MLVANPLHVVARIINGAIGVITGSQYSKAYFAETLKMLFDLFAHIRKVGVAAIEADVDDPAKSPVFSKYPKLLKDHHAVRFVCDTLRTFTSGTISHYDLDQLMELDMEVHHHNTNQPVAALSTVADSLPGLGIVAAVLGVIITMGALGGPPEEIGHKVAAALVGTFLGILLCYGFLGPIASNMAKINEAEGHYYRCLRQGILSFVKGAAPILAVEFARRTIPHHIRPTFQEMEAACKRTNAG
jgi:chemotaxis protein MotA